MTHLDFYSFIQKFWWENSSFFYMRKFFISIICGSTVEYKTSPRASAILLFRQYSMFAQHRPNDEEDWECVCITRHVNIVICKFKYPFKLLNYKFIEHTHFSQRAMFIVLFYLRVSCGDRDSESVPLPECECTLLCLWSGWSEPH